MGRHNFLIILGFAFAAIALFWGVDQARAGGPPSRGQAITGKSHDPASVPQFRKTTRAQRENVAKMAAAYREAARKRAKGGNNG